MDQHFLIPLSFQSFKSLSLKIVAMFVLLTISVIILIGTFMTDTTDRYYHDEFKNTNTLVFNNEYITSLCSNLGSENEVKSIIDSVSAYSGQLGIDSYRNYFLLDGKSGREVLSLLKYAGKELGVTLILVTHDLSVAEQAERIITLEDGKIVRDTKNGVI